MSAADCMIDLSISMSYSPRAFYEPQDNNFTNVRNHSSSLNTWPMKSRSVWQVPDTPSQRSSHTPLPINTSFGRQSFSPRTRGSSPMRIDTPTPIESKPQTPPRKESPPHKESPSRRFVPFSTKTYILVSDRISPGRVTQTSTHPFPAHNDDDQRVSNTRPSELMDIDTPQSSDRSSRVLFEQEVSDFWLSRPTKASLRPNQGSKTTKRHSALFPPKSKLTYPFPLPITLGYIATPSDIDSSSNESYSVLSDETVSRSPSPPLDRITSAQESEFFKKVNDTMNDAFSAWESRVGETSGEQLLFANEEDRFINLPEMFKSSVLMGKRPDGKGYWVGKLSFLQNTPLYRLKHRRKTQFGFEFGFIEDFDCLRGSLGGATLFYGRDRKVYYTDEDGDVDENEEGEYIFPVHGPYEIQHFGTNCILDPFPNTPEGGEYVNVWKNL